MTADQLETERPVLKATDLEPAADVDEAYLQVVQAIAGVTEVLTALKAADNSEIPLTYVATQDYIDELESAFRVGQRFLARDDLDDVREDMSRLDAETLTELRATVGYVAPHVGVEVSLPAPDRGGECDV